jgi:competence protein ComEC
VTAPLLPLAAAFALGVGLGLRTAPPAWLVAAAAVLLGLALAAARRGRLTAASAALLALVVLAGWARPALPDPWPAVVGPSPGTLRLEGVVSGEPEREGPRTRLPLFLQGVADAAGRRPARGQLVILVYGPLPPLRLADRIALVADVRAARPLRNPGTPAPGWREPARGAFVAVSRAASLERLPGAPLPWWLAVRARVHLAVQRHLPPVSGALLEGLLLGDRRALPPPLLADFRAAGVFHVLAISGFNVGLVATAALVVLRVVRLPGRSAAVTALFVLVGFAAVVGGQPSVLRATVMAGLVLVGRLLDRESRTWNSLAAALVLLLAWEPDALADPGLQLSFAATAGIVHLAPSIAARLPARWPRALAAAVAVSAGAQLAVTPLMLAHFSQLSLVGVVANLLVVPLAAALTTLGLLAVVVAAVSDLLAHALFQTLWLLLLGLRHVVRAFAAVPGAVLHLPAPPPGALLAAGVALVMLPLARTLRGRLGAGALAAVAAAATLWAYLPDGRLHVVMLDVGQGEAILVRTPDGRALLVDTGGGGPGRSDRGERVILPALRRRGIHHLAALVLTHGDPDHAGGLASLLEGVAIDEVWVPAGSEDAAWQAPVLAAGVPRESLARGDRRWVGPVLVTTLHPPVPAAGPPAWRGNDGSLVLRLEWGLASVVLTGDAGVRAEHALLDHRLPLAAPILKVGHHGSRHGTSSPFVTAVAPRLALVSAGSRNPFGHPDPAALARLDEAGAAIYRTDADGAVEVVSDGARLTVRRWARPQLVEEWLLDGAP